jgi:hypothetical protein
MESRKLLLGALAALCLLGQAAAAADPDKTGAQVLAVPDSAVAMLGKWRGTWDVKARRLHPLPAQDVAYSETFD